MTRKRKRNILLYIFIVLLPTIIGTAYTINKHKKDDLDQRIEAGKWVATIHESHWNQLINETVTSLETLALAAGSLAENAKQMEPLLRKAHETDPRYDGLYLLNRDGFVITGSNDYFENLSAEEKEFIYNAIHMKDLIISDRPVSLNNGHKVIGISSPVLDEDNQLIGVIVALLRVDYIQNTLNVLTPDAKLLLINGSKDIIMDFNTEGDNQFDTENWISRSIESLPWDIKVKISNSGVKMDSFEIFKIISLLTIFTHVLYLLIQYILLKRQATLERKENEAQKLDLVGSLAASTAHEIKNPLTGIKGLVQLLNEKYNNPTDQYYFSVINQEINRINEIVGEFLVLGKPTVQKMKTEDLRGIIQELSPLIASEAKLKNIDWTLSVPPHPMNVKCTKDQMKQVILNITKNAFEAMEDGGILQIEVIEKNRNVEVKVIDTGVGIPADKIKDIFNPFYTSKEAGTGLGLVICKRIIHSFNGDIHITSKEKKGTSVIIRLPLIR